MTIDELQDAIMLRAKALDHEPHVQSQLYRTATLLAGVGVLSRLVTLAEKAAPLIDLAVAEAAGRNPKRP